MTELAATSARDGTLRRGYLSLSELIAQSIGLVGAAGGAGLLIPAVFATAGNGTWLAYLFATVGLLFASWSITQFARRTASPGALYTYAARGLGPIWGAVAGWSLLIAYGVGAAGILQGTVNEIVVLFKDIGVASGAGLAVTVGITVFVTLGAWFITWRDIRLSTRTTLWIELSTVALILFVIVAALFAQHRWVDTHQLALTAVKPDQLRLGMVLAFFSFTGFESVTALGAEAREPFRLIPRAVIVSILGPAALFLAASYGLVALFQGAATPLDQASAPLSAVAHGIHLGALGVLIDAGVALSFFAAFFSSINAAARLLYTFARQGLLHAATGRAHAGNATPHVAVTLLVVLSLIVAVTFQFAGTSLFDAYGYLSTVATFGFLLTYVIVAVAAPCFLRRRGELKARHVAISAAAIVLIGIPFVGSIYPAAPGVYAVLPYVFGALLAAGLGWFLALRVLAPHRLRDIEAEFADADASREAAATLADARGVSAA
ncbi:APC family permease [Paraburkholderia tropica]|uniref:APC family permease n=1 Tax=Paraburkholderia tropica TaxID=92647 RepID=UPI002AB7104F|nr:APC family permease [Paraburkholderia tropica]